MSMDINMREGLSMGPARKNIAKAKMNLMGKPVQSGFPVALKASKQPVAPKLKVQVAALKKFGK